MPSLALPGVGCLREQSFRLLFTSQLLSAVGDTVASVAVPFAIIALGGGALPQTERAAREVLSLPLFPELTDEQVDIVCDALRRLG